MELKVLFIEDDEKLGQSLKRNFDGMTISGYQINAEVDTVFEKGINNIQNSDFDLVILDLYKDKETKDEEAGIKVLNEIRLSAFIPVIFYTGHAYKITGLISEIVGVVSKGDGIEALIKEIERIITSKIALIKSQIYALLKESLRKYFWETVDTEKQVFIPGKNDVSLGYLLLRRFANSLSKENIKQILGDEKIKINKAHPMEFYIYPSVLGEYETGEILKKDGLVYVILTPSCDFIEDGSRKRRVGKALLAIASPLTGHEYYLAFKKNANAENKKKLTSLIETRKGDQFFFLPETPFLVNSIIDFQNKNMFTYAELGAFERIAKLDDPFTQSMTASVIISKKVN